MGVPPPIVNIISGLAFFTSLAHSRTFSIGECSLHRSNIPTNLFPRISLIFSISFVFFDKVDEATIKILSIFILSISRGIISSNL